MNKYIFPLFFMIFACFQANAEIVTSSSITELSSVIEKENTLVIFGFDKTLVEASQPLGSKLWRDWVRDRVNTLEQEEVIPKALLAKHLTNLARFAVPMKPIEGEKTFAVIHQLKSNGTPYFLLTARPKDFINIVPYGFAKSTIRQLKGSGIDVPSIPELQDSLYEGVLFAQEDAKGAAVKELFLKHQYFPKHVIFFDNSYPAIQSVEEALQDLGIAFTGFHCDYTQSQPMDALIANIQLEVFLNEDRVPNVDEAMKIRDSLDLTNADDHFKSLIINSLQKITEKSFLLMRSL